MTAERNYPDRLTGGPLHVSLAAEPAWQALADDDVLAVVEHGTGVSASDDPRHVVTGFALAGDHAAAAAARHGSKPMGGSKPIRGRVLEVWRVDGPVRTGIVDTLRHAVSRDYLFGQVVIGADNAAGNFVTATQMAYQQLLRGCQSLGYPHVLRVWNVLSGINDGDGDAERYRCFSQGRFNAFVAAARLPVYPAASAIGRDGDHSIVYFLAGRAPAQLIENPQQVSAFRYPREYGPVSPSFSRAGLLRCGNELRLFISGTASILGHRSCHVGDIAAQLELTLTNLATVTAAAQAPAPLFDDRLQTLLRVYVRHPGDVAQVVERLDRSVPGHVLLTVVQGDICRRELLLEIEATVSWREGAV